MTAATKQPRKVGELEIASPSDREVAITRAFAAGRDLVFDAWTIPALLKRWLHGPEGWRLAVCEIDLKPGGATRYEWRHADGRSMGMSGKIREVVRPERVVATEIFDEDWTGGEAVGTVTFVESGGRTIVTQTMLYASREARDGALFSGMETGMEASYRHLDRLLAERPARPSQA